MSLPISAIRYIAALAALATIALAGAPALAQPGGYIVTMAPDSPERVAQLARDVDRARSLRQVKALQYLYTQYGEFGLWDEMAALFSDQGELQTDGVTMFKGRAAIAKHLKDEFNDGANGLPKGALHTDLLVQPVVILSYDGRSATARWQKLAMDARFGGAASWLGGMQVNEYVKEGGVWKIARINFYRQTAGTYETGFNAVKSDFPLVPYPYTPGRAGKPVPDEPSGADLSVAKDQTLEQTEAVIDDLNAEDQVRKLQNIYGYYVDRKLWSDVVDLFAADGVLEIAGQGVWAGPKSIRRELERDGPEGLQRGQVNDHIQMNAIVTIEPGGVEARARGLELAMLTPKPGEAYWAVSIFENRYVKQDGVWRIREMRIFPKMKADYYQGWHKSNVIDPKPAKANAPDRPSPAQSSPQLSGAIPVFAFPNPATGKPVAYPAGAAVVGDDRLLPAPNAPARAAATGGVAERLAVARQKLDLSKAYDAVENVANTFGYYLDDNMWDDMAALFSVNGTRPQGPGFYVGRDHILRAMTQSHYDGVTSPTHPRPVITVHQRLQPVIDIAPDGRSAKIRVRLFLYRFGDKEASGFSSGMYPNDTAVLEDGIWKLGVGGEIDETYFSSRNWKEGWAKVTQTEPLGMRSPWKPGMPAPSSGITNSIDFPPDVPWSLFENFRRKDMGKLNWPDIKPMWFAYRNPVSGRVPPNYCPEILKCFGY